MKLKFTKEEMAFLNAICDIEASADGTKTYSMKPMVINDNGETEVNIVDFLKEEDFITTTITDETRTIEKR
jgi:hypothetical protein